MIWIITALSILLAFFVFFLMHESGEDDIGAFSVDTGEDEHRKSRDTIASVKDSLRDLELEHSIGKIGEEDYLKIRAGLLARWNEAEKTLPILLLLIGLFFPGYLSAQSDPAAGEIQVRITNGSMGGTGTVEAISLLKLEGGMVPVETRENISGRVTFRKPADVQGPLMVQATYQGVKYSRVIPPNANPPYTIDLSVYNKSTDRSRINARMLVQITYANNGYIYLLQLHTFENRTRNTFSESEEGVYLYLPAGAQDIAASASVGSGRSDIQWLKLDLSESALLPGAFVASQAVKPAESGSNEDGSRIFQVSYRLPYDGNLRELRLRSVYELAAPMVIIPAPDDLEINYEDGKVLAGRQDPNLQRRIVELPSGKREHMIRLRGGTPLEPPQNSDSEEVTVTIKAPVSNAVKAGIAILFVLGITGIHRLLSGNAASGFLESLRRKELARLLTERSLIESSAYLPEKKSSLLANLDRRIIRIKSRTGIQ